MQDNKAMFDEGGVREKLIIFTEHKAPLRYLEGKIASLLGSDRAVVRIYGSMLRAERRKVEELFRQDKDVYVLIATDAAGEGLIMKSPNGYPGY